MKQVVCPYLLDWAGLQLTVSCVSFVGTLGLTQGSVKEAIKRL